jgi:hypothetical protein
MAYSLRWVLRVLLFGAVMASLLVLVAGPAPASTVTVEAPTSAGAYIVVTCPSGEQFVSGSIAFYPKQGAPRPLRTRALSPIYDATGTYLAGGAAYVPKGARYYIATATCEPRPGVTTTTSNL